MTSRLTLESLREAVANGDVDTVLACQVDMQGRLMGKRFHAAFFLEHALQETHCCNYLLATDQEMEPVEGYAATSWQTGYGDYAMVPDFSTLRLTPWLEGTALVLCDVQDHQTHTDVPHSPRAILRRQIARLDKLGLKPMMATELEFFLFSTNYRDANQQGFRDLELVSPYNEDYHIFQTSKEEDVMRAIRNGLYGAGITVENSKGEASAGQEEINILYADALTTADNHVIVKNACKEIAWSRGKSLTFMAKWHNDSAGSSSHIHQSLWSNGGSTSAFHDPDKEFGMSTLMRQYVAGLLAHASELTYFLAPNINSYKRFVAGTFAPTRAIWSPDNRTAGYRLCAANSKSVRIECRVGGSDLNPYLAMASQIAAGLAGIEGTLELEPAFTGDAYQGDNLREIPTTLRAATVALNESAMLREAFGEEVIDHYVHSARWEQQAFDAQVTDWEVQRGFERA
jgi:glutamine synthetase